MGKEHVIAITNGKGSKEISNGNYTVTAEAAGYDSSTISPATQEITEGVNSYIFTIAATGALTLHVSDDGTEIGVPIEGATFYRCDSEGNQYGDAIVTDVDGNAIFNNVPFSIDGTSPTIYFKQTQSDGEHIFSPDLQNTPMDADAKTIEIANEAAPLREFNLTDANYAGLPVMDGSITLTSD